MLDTEHHDIMTRRDECEAILSDIMVHYPGLPEIIITDYFKQRIAFYRNSLVGQFNTITEAQARADECNQLAALVMLYGCTDLSNSLRERAQGILNGTVRPNNT